MFAYANIAADSSSSVCVTRLHLLHVHTFTFDFIVHKMTTSDGNSERRRGNRQLLMPQPVLPGCSVCLSVWLILILKIMCKCGLFTK